MTAENFAYWLQGYNEIAQTPPTAEQWKIIQDHLKLVFTKVTPERITAANVFADGKNCGDPSYLQVWSQPSPVGNPCSEKVLERRFYSPYASAYEGPGCKLHETNVNPFPVQPPFGGFPGKLPTTLATSC